MLKRRAQERCFRIHMEYCHFITESRDASQKGSTLIRFYSSALYSLNSGLEMCLCISGVSLNSSRWIRHNFFFSFFIYLTSSSYTHFFFVLFIQQQKEIRIIYRIIMTSNNDKRALFLSSYMAILWYIFTVYDFNNFAFQIAVPNMPERISSKEAEKNGLRLMTFSICMAWSLILLSMK